MNLSSFASTEAILSNTTQTTLSHDATLCSRGNTESDMSRITRISTQVIISFIMFGLGCSTDFKSMWGYIKQPKQFVTSLLLQLLLMPFLGFGLSRLFMMSEAETMGVIIQASCPGGAYSNIASYWLDGDMDLSIVMTTVSTIFALGTIPLWLFVFPTIMQIQNNCLQVPFESLGYALLSIIAPILLGLLVKHFFPKKAHIVTKVCTAVGSGSIIVLTIVIATTQENSFIIDLSWRIAVLAFVFPALALLLGYLATRVPWFTFSVAARRTVAIETAMQNTAVASSIVLLSFDTDFPLFGSIFLFPVLYAAVQLFSTIIAVASYQLCKHRGRCSTLQPGLDEKISYSSESSLKGISNAAFDDQSCSSITMDTVNTV